MNDVQKTPAPTAALAASELRHARARKLAIAFGLWVGVPTLVAVVYYGAIATPQYESVAVMTVDAPAPVEPPSSKASKGIVGPDLDALREHLLSRPTMENVDREQGLSRHWQGSRVDWWSRLPARPKAETAHDYYLGKVSAEVDSKGATLTLRVRAFSPRKAQQIANALVASSERFIDRISARAVRRLGKVADERVAVARERLVKARAANPATDDGDAALELELAREEMRAALGARESERIEAARRRHDLVVVAAPSLPAEARYPRRIWSVATVFFAALVLMSVFRLFVAVVREHAQL